MNDNLLRAVDAFSASPAIRLRYQILADKTRSSPEPVFPPPTELQTGQHPYWESFNAVARAAADGHPLAELIQLRQEAADEIERLLAFLDESEGIIGEDVFDGDEDAEPEHDEPSLGWTDTEAHRGWETRGFVDAELDTCDDEPSFGFSEPVLTGAERDYWFPYYSKDTAQPVSLALACTGDREDEHDGREPDDHDEDGGDDEFNLGWTDAEAGTGRHGNNGLDLEDDDAFHDTDLGWTRAGAWGNTRDFEMTGAEQ